LLVRAELGAMLRLALPVIAAEIGWITMGLADTIMVGPLGPAAIGAVGAGSILYFAVMVVGFGTITALDTFVSHSFGAGRIDDCHRWLIAGLQVAGILTIVLTLLSFALIASLGLFRLHPDVLALIRPYMTHLQWSTPLLLVYAVLRRYLQAMHVVRPIMYVLVIANLVNIAANWVLIYGHLGFPALGVVGSAYATVLSRLVVAVVLIGFVLGRERQRPSGLHDAPLVWENTRIRRILRLGLPAAGQNLLEVGIFAMASALAGRIAPISVAAHQVVLSIVGFVFMVPFGFSSAAAVRVGHAIGRGDPQGARRAGWAALALATCAMLLSAALFAGAPRLLIGIFTQDARVIELGAGLLLVAALFQIFDGVQAVATGALRGLGNTHVPMFVNLVGHWALGLPLAYFLCFRYGFGVQGLWMGLAFGLIFAGAVLLVVWQRDSRALANVGGA
jgi:MATE family multidrug resistance protein